ncbi:MAG: dockerin type I repeat-containing protein [Ruminococcus sp.]|uniref:dockerin type I repeat-containing protein n=1 Tax=Ruminococcus sp. TaxID=41978 RepID=UPI002873EAC3|nr:dockerin type I repeat-containing protein [Ruminococcus sp.]MBQ3285483.1 dockerin type I repeat-containing protein [Ruminococcus sp.]
MLKKTLSLILILGIVIAAFAVVPFRAETPVVIFYGTDAAPLLGDVNGDGTVDSTDATFIQRRLADMPLPFLFDLNIADTDEDGYITVFDTTVEQRWISKMASNDNIGKPADIWLDKNTATHYDSTFSGDMVITEVYPTYFLARPVTSLPTEFKIHAILGDSWRPGDQIWCTYCNVYYSHDYDSYCFEREEGCMISIQPSTFVPDPNVCYKPVIYLYPEEETEVNVQLDLDGEFLTTYPAYEDGWTVTAAPDGTLTDESGKTYPYLFWEGKLNADYDLSKGFCVKGEDTEAFLNEKLAVLGLNDKEIADFTEFWVGCMAKNRYNVISFQTTAYTDAAQLNISPAPDSVIRVFMTWYASDKAVDIPAQELTAPARSGFTAVEWGGQMVAK